MLYLIHLAHAGLLADCPAQSTSAELTATADAAIKAVEELEDSVVFEKRELLLKQLVCVGEPLSPGVIGKIHWVQVITSFMEARKQTVEAEQFTPDDTRTVQALSGLFSVQPGFQFPEYFNLDKSLVDLAILRLNEPEVLPLPSVVQGRIEANGRIVTKLKEQVAAVIQQFDGEQNLLQSCYWWPGDPVGGCAVAEPESKRPETPRSTPDPDKPALAPWIVGGASVAALGTGLGLVVSRSGDWEDYFGDCLGEGPPLFPKADAISDSCGFESESVADLSYASWRGGWYAGLGLIGAGVLGLSGSTVLVLTDGRMVVLTAQW